MVMLDAFEPDGAERFRTSLRRAVGLALVLVLHAIALFLLATSTVIRTTVPAFIAHETELILLPKPRLKKAVRVPVPETRSRTTRVPSFTLPPMIPDVSGVGRSLFGCLGQIGCTNPLAIAPGAVAGTVGPPRSHVLDEAHWEAALAEERTPARVPCTYTKTLNEQDQMVFMIDARCMLKMMLGSTD
jgi:hypothetical protein